MTSNKYLIVDKSALLKNKLQSLASTLDSNSATGDYQTQEEVIQAALEVLSSFYKSLNEPGFNPEQVHPDDYPDKNIYNETWDELLDDLTVIFSELENLGNVTVANFNFITTDSNRLTARLKNVSSLLGDYILYTNNATGDAIFFKDSFNDLSKVDTGSSLLNAAEGDIDQDEGVVTLAIDTTRDSEVKIKAAPIINPNSNGVIGNNQELNANFNGDPTTILDNNPDTWFEYERVTPSASDTKDPLILDMTLNLGDESIINFIRINPNNFGTKTAIVIDTIETSLDGLTYTNIKDDIPIADFVTEDEANIFTLAPATSKFAGQGIYTFLPRKAKYIHLVFRQSEPYLIDTTSGEQLRYAIGIRDIDVRAYVYQSTSEIVSEPFTLLDEARKVILDANQNPIEKSELASIDWSISPDDGQTWYLIQPKSFNGISGKQDTTPEILNFNGPETDSISTSVPVTSLRVKATMTRNDAAFQDGSSTLRKQVLSTSELHTVPNSSPFEITTEQPPVDGSLEVIDPSFGSRGLPDSKYIVGNATKSGPEQSIFYTPFVNLERPVKKVGTGSPVVYSLKPVDMSEWIHFTVGGQEWSHATQPLSSYTANYSTDPQYRLVAFDPSTGVLSFGTGDNTMAPPAGNPIGMYFEPERVFPSETPDSHLAQLEFKTGNDKTAFIINRYEPAADFTETVPRKATVLHLQNQNLTETVRIANVLQSLGFDASPTTYVNGHDELTSSTKWSVDMTNGVIYLGTATPADRDVSLTYNYQPIFTLSTNDWDWGSTNTIRDSISIKETGWKTNTVSSLSLPTTTGLRVFDLGHLSVVKGTLLFILNDASGDPVDDTLNPFIKEVPFIDGTTELGGDVIKTVEKIPDLIPSGISNIATFHLGENISSNSTDFIVSFSNSSIFKTNNPALSSPGDWDIDRTVASPTYGRVSVRLPDGNTVTGSSSGTITYYYTNPRFTDNGLYSVDYVHGRIYTQRTTTTGWVLTADYQYTDYRALYKIARVLDPQYYDVDVTNQTITIKDEEILRHNIIPRELLPNQSLFYQLNYDYVAQTREDIGELQPYFSPMIKDYVLKIITKSNLI